MKASISAGREAGRTTSVPPIYPLTCLEILVEEETALAKEVFLLRVISFLIASFVNTMIKRWDNRCIRNFSIT